MRIIRHLWTRSYDLKPSDFDPGVDFEWFSKRRACLLFLRDGLKRFVELDR